MSTSERDERVARWCTLAGFGIDALDGSHRRVTVDARLGLTVEVELGDDDEPLRVHDRFQVDPEVASVLDDDLVESVVLGRSSMIDARLAPPGGVETVVAVYPDGLSRHTFMIALYEVQKVRDLVIREAARRSADAATVAELERLVAESAG